MSHFPGTARSPRDGESPLGKSPRSKEHLPVHLKGCEGYDLKKVSQRLNGDKSATATGKKKRCFLVITASFCIFVKTQFLDCEHHHSNTTVRL